MPKSSFSYQEVFCFMPSYSFFLCIIKARDKGVLFLIAIKKVTVSLEFYMQLKYLSKLMVKQTSPVRTSDIYHIETL